MNRQELFSARRYANTVVASQRNRTLGYTPGLAHITALAGVHDNLTRSLRLGVSRCQGGGELNSFARQAIQLFGVTHDDVRTGEAANVKPKILSRPQLEGHHVVVSGGLSDQDDETVRRYETPRNRTPAVDAAIRVASRFFHRDDASQELSYCRTEVGRVPVLLVASESPGYDAVALLVMVG